MPEELKSGYKKLLRMPEKVITASAAMRKQQMQRVIYTALSIVTYIGARPTN